MFDKTYKHTSNMYLNTSKDFRASVSLSISLVTLYAVLFTTCDALRMINFDAPDSAFQGDTINLRCFFSLQNGHQQSNVVDSFQSTRLANKKFKSNLSNMAENSNSNSEHLDPEIHLLIPEISGTVEQLYAVKWYKNDREFFRYLTQDWPRKQALPAEGVFVDLDKSDNYTVVLRNVSLKTSGQFRCEVSTDAPYFVTKSMERKLLIYSLPNEGPVIEIVKHSSSTNHQKGRCYLNEQVELKCSTSESKPAATLDWIINDFLNLSAPIESQLKRLFTINSRRFVRIPSGNENSSNNYQANGGRTSSKALQRQQIVPFETYELAGDNATLASSPVNKREPTLVNLPGNTLDQLLEMTVSRLNFTVDANLFQLLSYIGRLSSREGSTYQAEIGQNNRKSSTLERAPISESLLVLLNSTSSDRMIPNKLATNAIRNKRSRKPVSEIPSIYLFNSDISSSQKTVPVNISKTRLPNSSFITTFKRPPNQMGVTTTNDIQAKQVQLKIRCVARLSQLTMSHQTKIYIVNKTKESEEEDLTLINALRRQRTSDKNSAAISKISNFQAIFLLLSLIINLAMQSLL